MIRKALWTMWVAVATLAGLPPSFGLRTLLALVFGNAIGVAAVLACLPHSSAEIATMVWCVPWTLVILTFAAADEARRGRRRAAPQSDSSKQYS
jgi:hypothetical protein